jgi:2,4-dienoyl-CoA reductase-like NADH-dependent reductase (Old Yellow Enzyme family)
MPDIKPLGRLKTVSDFRAYVTQLGLDLQADDTILKAPESPLADPVSYGDRTIGNRFAIHPMEGWDGEADGNPSENTIRRWQNFGRSGAKFIWGGEAVAVRAEGRANPNQLIASENTKSGLGSLRDALLSAHQEHVGDPSDLLLGLQLTHSGRFCRPNSKALEPRIVYRHPLLDAKFGITDNSPVLSDDEIRGIVRDYHSAAKMAADLGYDFVDVKHCHGYLGHEFLSAFTRPGPYGGSFENRTRFLREIVDGIRSEAPGLDIGVRLSFFDVVPYRPNPNLTVGRKLGPGIPEPFDEHVPYRYAFGVDPDAPASSDLDEPFRFLQLLQDLGIRLVNLSAGSPYYNPHIQRPAFYPPSDGYQPPEDPLVGVARQLDAVSKAKKRFPDLLIVGTAYSYLQEYLPHVAQHEARSGRVDFVGLGRMVLSYPELPLDVLQKGTMAKRLICRTFSDCTTAPRNGMISGCFPLDPYYKKTPEGARLREIKKSAAAGT